MERQRSFSFKPTRFLVFSFTISSSLTFISFFSIWVIKSTPLISHDTHLHFNKASLSLLLKPIGAQNSAGFSRNYAASGLKGSILIDAQISKPENVSGLAEISAKPENISGLAAEISVVVGIQRKEGEPGAADGEIEDIGAMNGNFSTSNLSIEEIDAVNSNFSTRNQSVFDASSFENGGVSSSEGIEEKKTRECDVTKGRWVFDGSYPLYTNSSCPFIDEGFNCEGNGRLNRDYMKWRWQPQDCDIPRFNAADMLNLIRGKRLIFVGDSINRNQWESMLCLLMGAVKDPRRVYETRGRRITKEKGSYSFKFVDYRCTVEYYVSHFLVHESKTRIGKKRVQTLRIDAMDRGTSRWKGADILVFNTAHWWSHYKTQTGINYYQEGNLLHPHLDVLTAFRRAMTTWASWVDKHINPGKTQVFFRSSAPSHFRGGEWNTGGHCKEATQPLDETTRTMYPEKNVITEEVIRQMRTPVTILNVTALSEYRIDAHPSVYGRKSGKKGPSSIEDCSHWCLPGVPDNWNELLYFYLQQSDQKKSHSRLM
ncbi:protein trichome birefringence-like 6 [Malania oleifera]|uniref:protein trichome birefringence-like 6 n=1 Tax=Malania oleifera TaxID=397392 RepID=UPI0025AE872C|nr:protein trichome birefringence-like 6 [Malania oleifera]